MTPGLDSTTQLDPTLESTGASLVGDISPPNAVLGGPVAPANHWIWGNILDIQQDMLKFHLSARRNHGDFLRVPIGRFWNFYFLAHPDDIERVLHQPASAVNKGVFWKRLKMLLGEGLLTNDGDAWKQQRRVMQPAFHRHRHDTFARIIAKTTEEMLDRWQPLAKSGEPFELTEEMMRLTLQNAGLTIFGEDMSAEAKELGDALTYALEYVNVRSFRWLLPSHANQFKKSRQTLYRIIDDMIRRRREQLERGDVPTIEDVNGNNGHDLLTALLVWKDETTGEGMSTRQLRDELMTFIFTGHETTAIALTWTWYMLSLHPDVERRMHAELAEVLGGRTPTNEDLPQLTYTRMIIQETMRLYPPVWALSRQFNEAEEIRGHRVPPNVPVVVMPYVTHRHPAFWDNPEGFEPERFTPERSAGRPRYAYFPFGGGPRQCLGNHFAMMEAQLILATVAQKYRLHALPGHPVDVAPWVSLRPRFGLMMTLHKR
jgi:cytochrome P450